jgi:hypothetical protein
MLGVNCDNRDSVHGLRKVAWRRTLGWKDSRSLHTSESSKTHTCLGRVIQRKLVRTIFDN